MTIKNFPYKKLNDDWAMVEYGILNYWGLFHIPCVAKWKQNGAYVGDCYSNTCCVLCETQIPNEVINDYRKLYLIFAKLTDNTELINHVEDLFHNQMGQNDLK